MAWQASGGQRLLRCQPTLDAIQFADNAASHAAYSAHDASQRGNLSGPRVDILQVGAALHLQRLGVQRHERADIAALPRLEVA